jgi:hypothetical protein
MKLAGNFAQCFPNPSTLLLLTGAHLLGTTSAILHSAFYPKNGEIIIIIMHMPLQSTSLPKKKNPKIK